MSNNVSSWLYRRRVVTLTLLYCAAIILHLMFFGVGESYLHANIAKNLILLMSATIVSYVFGHVMDEGDGFRKDNALGQWKKRRQLIFNSLFFCAFVILYLTVEADDTLLNQTIADGFCLMAAAIQSTYVFGSVMEDNKFLHGLKDPKKEDW